MIFGLDRMSYTVLLNSQQCMYRLYLMGQDENRGKSLLFPPMVRGLVLHKAMELVVNGEQPTIDAMKNLVVQPSRPDVDFGERIIVWGDVNPDNFWSDLGLELDRFVGAFCKFLDGCKYEKIAAEKGFHRTFKTPLQGHVDLALKVNGSWICADLKTGKHNPQSEQFLLYSWLANGFCGRPVPFWVLVWDGEALTRKVVHHLLTEDNPKLMRLLWQMEELHMKLSEAHIRILDGAHPAWVLKPNTRHFTCSDNRCSYYSVCPYGKKKNDGGEENDDIYDTRL